MSNPTRSVTVVTRALDAVDRAHARVATVLHNARTDLLAKVDRGLDRAEQLTASVFQRAHRSVKRADVVSADAVNKAQGVVGQAIEKARLARSQRAHVVS